MEKRELEATLKKNAPKNDCFATRYLSRNIRVANQIAAGVTNQIATLAMCTSMILLNCIRIIVVY